MNCERLTKLRDYLLDVPATAPKFDMNSWGEGTPECLTAACAGGHATLIPEFREAGLLLEYDSHNRLIPVFAWFMTFSALATFFGVGKQTSLLVFDPESYDDVRIEAVDVAERITALLELGEDSFAARYAEE